MLAAWLRARQARLAGNPCINPVFALFGPGDPSAALHLLHTVAPRILPNISPRVSAARHGDGVNPTPRPEAGGWREVRDATTNVFCQWCNKHSLLLFLFTCESPVATGRCTPTSSALSLYHPNPLNCVILRRPSKGLGTSAVSLYTSAGLILLTTGPVLSPSLFWNHGLGLGHSFHMFACLCKQSDRLVLPCAGNSRTRMPVLEGSGSPWTCTLSSRISNPCACYMLIIS